MAFRARREHRLFGSALRFGRGPVVLSPAHPKEEPKTTRQGKASGEAHPGGGIPSSNPYICLRSHPSYLIPKKPAHMNKNILTFVECVSDCLTQFKILKALQPCTPKPPDSPSALPRCGPGRSARRRPCGPAPPCRYSRSSGRKPRVIIATLKETAREWEAGSLNRIVVNDLREPASLPGSGFFVVRISSALPKNTFPHPHQTLQRAHHPGCSARPRTNPHFLT